MNNNMSNNDEDPRENYKFKRTILNGMQECPHLLTRFLSNFTTYRYNHGTVHSKYIDIAITDYINLYDGPACDTLKFLLEKECDINRDIYYRIKNKETGYFF